MTMIDTPADLFSSAHANVIDAPAPSTRPQTRQLVAAIVEAGEDFEWYPTTAAMLDKVAACIPTNAASVMDIGAGDGRALVAISDHIRARKAVGEASQTIYDRDQNKQRQPTQAEYVEKYRAAFANARGPQLYSIEKSPTLAQAQPADIIPVGTDFYQQNLACLPVDFIFCNPPYSDFETWASAVIETGYAKRAFVVIPRRWTESTRIKQAIAKRKATTRVIYSGDFETADRKARAVVDIIEIRYPSEGWGDKPQDPFNVWFDQNVSTFDVEEKPEEPDAGQDINKQRTLDTIAEMVAQFDEDYARMESNYRQIFAMDHAILNELGVTKEAVREGIKLRMAGLKTRYWHMLFEKFGAITSRLSTKTKEEFLKKLTDRQSIAFTAANAYAVALWSIKNANKYYDQQLIQLFRDLSTFDGVMNYKSNQRTWKKENWRYCRDEAERPTEYALDYRIVVEMHNAIRGPNQWDAPGGLDKKCHEQIEDIIAVMGNLGFRLGTNVASRSRQWEGGKWQDFKAEDDSTVLFQVKGYMNGNLHFRFKPEAIRALNVEAGRLLGWIKSKDDVMNQLGYSAADAAKYFNSSIRLGVSSLPLLAGPTPTN